MAQEGASVPSGRPVERVVLRRRRGLARVKSALAYGVAVLVLALSGAALAFVAIFAVARLWTWIRRRDIDQFWLWDLAPEMAIALSVAVVVAFGVIVFRWFWLAAIDKVLADAEATRLDRPTGARRRFVDLVDEVSTGIAKDAPEIWITEDETPNALSLRSRTRRVVCVTTAVLDLPRHEQEVIVAHELAHVWSDDAHVVTSGLVALATARRAGTEIWAGGVVLSMVSGWLAFQGLFLWGTFVTGAGLFLVGGFAAVVLRPLELSVRRQSDELADVAAVRLARDPESLGKLCLRLAEDVGRVGPAPTSAQYLWFEAVEEIRGDANLEIDVPVRTRREMYLRAERAYAEARVPLPEDARERMEEWRRRHP